MNHFYLIAVCSGAAIATQAAMNAQLGQLLGSPLLASSVAFGSALLFAVLAVLVSSHSPPSREALEAVPIHLWFGGGILSAFGISMFYFLIPKIGMGQLMALALTGQLLVAMLAGHFSWFNAPHRPIDAMSGLGVLALVAGVSLINRGA
ncbi:hypothetical protein LPB72_03495 [Hydrogenophaga crassostreae]|uniref:DMT family transporter n=1 Tax=Hydrogenophaga crassostreae TaxID=1763535 RepID=A0ABX2UAY6_9BURK|nr:DMT family transporter [Hydrogenophaga crassostreae]OAD43605.1 hypothetical protein LPB72_03495 [Hydrogenophaga crassostreae]